MQIALGEDSRRQFKRDVTHADALAAEMAAFANSEGGVILENLAKAKIQIRRPKTAPVFKTEPVYREYRRHGKLAREAQPRP